MVDGLDTIRREIDAGAAWEPPVDDEPRRAGRPAPPPFGIIARGDVARWIGKTPAPVPFVIGDFVEQGSVALLAGEGGAGKSFVALNAGIAVAAGGRFYGKTAMAGRAVCLFCEDSDGAIHVRLTRMCDALGIRMEDLAGRLLALSLVDDPVERRTLWQDRRPTSRLEVLEAELAAIPDLRLLALDNVTHLFNGDEISRQEVGGFLIALTAMARRLGIGIILIHHASKSQDGSSLRMASGSTAWVAQCRAAAELRKASGEEGPKFAVRKINNGREWELELRWTDDGALLPVQEAVGAVASIERRGHERTFLECLDLIAAQGRSVSDIYCRVPNGPNKPRNAPKLVDIVSHHAVVKHLVAAGCVHLVKGVQIADTLAGGHQ